MPKLVRFSVILFLTLFVPLQVGCGFVSAVVPAVASVISDSSAVLNIIQQSVSTWFMHKPDRELQAQFNSAINDAWTALRTANALTSGAKNISQEEYDAAFADFQKAYVTLHDMLKKHGILKGTTLSGDGVHEYEIAEPMALTFKVDQ